MMQAIAGLCGITFQADQLCRSMLAASTSRLARLAQSPEIAMPVILGSAPHGPPLPSDAHTFLNRGSGHDHPSSSFEVLLVADARLNNRSELTQQLDLSREASQQQILKAAWQRWGTGMADHLLGGFALACFDPAQQTLLLARDHAGERPLHFARPAGNGRPFAFASMPLALCALPWIGHTLNLERLVLALSMVEPQADPSFFAGVERLPAGHSLTLTPQGMTIRRYWHPSDARPIRYRRDEEYVEDLRERFDRAVADRLESEGVMTAGLSGGLDSSSVAVTAARLLAPQGRRLTAFTAVPIPGYDGRALPGRFGDEGAIAAEAAALYPNIDHVLVDSAERDLVETCRRASRLSGEPTGNPSNRVWMDAILDGVRNKNSYVLLEGEGGNSTISYGGIPGLSELFRSGRWLKLWRQTVQLRAGGHVSWRAAAAWAAGPLIPLRVRRLLQPEMRRFSLNYSAIHPDRALEYDLQSRAYEAFYGMDSRSHAERIQKFEGFDYGVYNGASAMGWQVEQRDPTQDKRIFEFCFGIPPEQFLAGGQSRSLVRRAMQGRLPEATLRRADRGIQSADWYLLMGAQRDRLATELRRVEKSPLVRYLLDTARLDRLLQNWPESGHGEPDVHAQWHLALSRGIATAGFIAEYDPGMPCDSK